MLPTALISIFALSLGQVPFAPLSADVLSDSDLPLVLSAGDLVFDRPDIKGPRRSYTGLALVNRPCADIYKIIADPRSYPRVYPMIKRVEINSEKASSIKFTMEIVAGPGSASRKAELRRHAGLVLSSHQSVGNSSWNFFGLGAGSCIIHFTHDEDFTSDSMMLRMALRKKRSLVEGLKAAAAVSNVGDVRRYFERGSVVSEPRQQGTRHANSPTTSKAVQVALARLSRNSTVALMSRRPGDPVLVAKHVRGSRAELRKAVSSAETWRRDIVVMYSSKQKAAGPNKRHMYYTIESIFEDIDFETMQKVQAHSIDERIIGGELDSGGWSWTMVESPPHRALLLSLGLHLEEGDWLVNKLSKKDSSVADGTALGIAFRLVDGLAQRVDK